MNYRHAYHAGGFADVFKHFVQVQLLKSLQQKDTPFTYIDTHSGSGLYDLNSEHSEKTAEAKQGIQLLWDAKLPLSDSVQEYLAVVKEHQLDKTTLNYYPGSPSVARALLRAQDHMILNELHPEEVQFLKKQFKQDQQVNVHSQNAYQWLLGVIPPATKRGLVFIDPPYEKLDEYEQLVQLLIKCLKRWPNGIYAIWYPITKDQKLNQFFAALKKAQITNILNTQLSVYDTDSPIGLNGSGVLIINSPWQLDTKLRIGLQELWNILSPGKKGGHLINCEG